MKKCLSNEIVGSKYSFYYGQIFGNAAEVNDGVYLHVTETIRNLRLIKNESRRVRAICAN